ncbi:MAG: efflux RND transporter periplasmic adaptor subunit [Hyphomicrobiales bacterium]|jgi:cobalt-zinc-cadmium efflux system membrane fusion protein|nr:MAG: efflux RND transporter periplasmic adaptor subunit [Hyphomicrobiales bacterium]
MNRYMRIASIVLVAIFAVGGAAFYLGAKPDAGKSAPAAGKKEEHHGEEGAVTLSDAKIAAANIELVKAGGATLRDGLALNGIIQPNQEALVQVTPRFPGVVRDIRRRIGDVVAKGDLLASVESNQSLTAYELRAPIAGTVIDRQVSLGEYVSEQKPAFVLADLSAVWVDFSVYRRDIQRVKVGDKVAIEPEDGGQPIETTISYVSPVGSSETQSALARAVVNNADGRLRPGLFVRARVILTAKSVPLAVKLSALQTIENRTVVFVRSGDKFEPRDVMVGGRDQEWAEISFGLESGDTYAARNSFVIKAELAKGTASHAH